MEVFFTLKLLAIAWGSLKVFILQNLLMFQFKAKSKRKDYIYNLSKFAATSHLNTYKGIGL